VQLSESESNCLLSSPCPLPLRPCRLVLNLTRSFSCLPRPPIGPNAHLPRLPQLHLQHILPLHPNPPPTSNPRLCPNTRIHPFCPNVVLFLFIANVVVFLFGYGDRYVLSFCSFSTRTHNTHTLPSSCTFLSLLSFPSHPLILPPSHPLASRPQTKSLHSLLQAPSQQYPQRNTSASVERCEKDLKSPRHSSRITNILCWIRRRTSGRRLNWREGIGIREKRMRG
jgi:hypothetical protein